MAQSATDSRKFLLHIDAFWEKANITHPLSWEKWKQQRKLAKFAKDRFQLEILLKGPHTAVTYPHKPVYEDPVEKHTQATERDGKIRNQQLKVTCKIDVIDNIDIFCCDKP